MTTAPAISVETETIEQGGKGVAASQVRARCSIFMQDFHFGPIAAREGQALKENGVAPLTAIAFGNTPFVHCGSLCRGW
jgi:hypothetical protein